MIIALVAGAIQAYAQRGTGAGAAVSAVAPTPGMVPQAVPLPFVLAQGSMGGQISDAIKGSVKGMQAKIPSGQSDANCIPGRFQ